MNLLHPWLTGAGGPLPLPPDDLPGQINLLGRLLAASGFAEPGTTIVCDGATPPGWIGASTAGIPVRFAGGGREADELLESLIAQESGPRSLLVVSSDRRIQRAAQRRRARVATSEQFLARLRAPAGDTPNQPVRPREALTEQEVAKWLEEFGLE